MTIKSTNSTSINVLVVLVLAGVRRWCTDRCRHLGSCRGSLGDSPGPPVCGERYAIHHDASGIGDNRLGTKRQQKQKGNKSCADRHRTTSEPQHRGRWRKINKHTYRNTHYSHLVNGKSHYQGTTATATETHKQKILQPARDTRTSFTIYRQTLFGFFFDHVRRPNCPFKHRLYWILIRTLQLIMMF